MNGVFEFDEDGLVEQLNITFEGGTEKNAWCSFMKSIGGRMTETRIQIIPKLFSEGLLLVEKEKEKKEIKK